MLGIADRTTGTPLHGVNGPLIAVIAISGISLAVALLWSPLASTIAYACTLLIGSGLIFWNRTRTIQATRRAGADTIFGVSTVEKIAIGTQIAACLANGIVIALELSTWKVFGG